MSSTTEIRPIQKTSVLIIGAGAAGLQTAYSLLHDRDLNENDAEKQKTTTFEDFPKEDAEILILEARDRVGGRIHTWSPNSSSDHSPDHSHFPDFVDLGAAWVHGTEPIPSKNPMMQYLSVLPSSSASPDDSLCQHRLVEIAPGNPWMRPWTVLHCGQRGGNERVGNDDNNDNDGADMTKNNEECSESGVGSLNNPQFSVHENNARRLMYVYHQGKRIDTDEHVMQKAMKRHFDMFHKAIPRYARSLYQTGQGLATVHTSVQQAIDEILITTTTKQCQTSSNTTRDDNDNDDDDERVDALVHFYRHLVATWYGQSCSALQLANFASSDDEEDDDDDDESLDKNYNTATEATSTNIPIHHDNTKASSSPPLPPDWYYTEEGDYLGPHCIIQGGGMQNVLEPLVAGIPREQIILHQIVTEIWQHDSDREDHAIRVRTHTGQVYAAKACVVTLPVHCLQHDEPTLFAQTPISTEKQEALQHLSMGSYKKVMVAFDRIFWPVEPPFLGLLRKVSSGNNNSTTGPSSELGESLLVDNLWAEREGKACLEAVLVGDAAKWAFRREDAEIRDAVLDFIHHAMGVDRSDLSTWCIDCHVTRWEEDPFCRGAYASLSLGALPRHVEAMTQPEWGGALVFAGEATVDEFEGSVHAALLSGMVAAEHVRRFLK